MKKQILGYLVAILIAIVSCNYGVTPFNTFWLWFFTNVPLIILSTAIINFAFDDEK